MTKKFSEIIQVRKVGSCHACSTYSYILPVNLTANVEDHLLPFGSLKYNLSKCGIVQMENEIIAISGARLGMNTLKVKFKKNKAEYKKLFDIHISAFVESEMNITIEL